MSKHTSERRSVSKSRELKRTTDFSEEDKLLIWICEYFRPTLTRSGRLENVCSGRQLDFVQMETFVIFLETHATGGESMWKEVGLKFNSLFVQLTTSYFLLHQDRHLFQQQFVFNIEINR